MSPARFACCNCCPDDDPRWHAENGRGAHDGPCPTCERMAAERPGAVRALREAASEVAYGVEWDEAPESVEEWLAARADAIEAGEQP